MSVTRGHCLCGAVTYEFDGEDYARCYCHCESCRRATSSPVTAFFRVKLANIRFTGAPPRFYRSSQPVRRSFCGTCGSPISYECDERPEEIDILAITLEKPEGFAPLEHDFANEMLSWVRFGDGLPQRRRD